jgi:hypothetical protein
MTVERYLMEAKKGEAVYVEDVFSTYLYTGNGATRTITNGIDLAGKGGLVWIKQRSGSQDHTIFDTARGVNNYIRSNSTGAQNSGGTYTDLLTAFSTTGFTLGADASTAGFVNASGQTYASWTFRDQPKFFDVVTYTGNGVAGRQISHALGATPGMMIVKNLTNAANWPVWHKSVTAPGGLFLNTTAASSSASFINVFGNGTSVVPPTSSVFTVGSNSLTNANGDSYVAYIFADQAGGFGLSGSDSVVACGSFTTDGSGAATVTLGWEPQYVLMKSSSAAGTWIIDDVMRGATATGTSPPALFADTSAAESANARCFNPTATGFIGRGVASTTYIYLAIRRGPMKVPTSGTSVFNPVTTTASNEVFSSLEAGDLGIFKDAQLTSNIFVSDRLRGFTSYYNETLYTNLTNAGATPTTGDTVTVSNSEAGVGNGKIYFGGGGVASDKPTGYAFRRAPNFFDEVCYTGTGVARTVAHNLGVAPELMIVKRRDSNSLQGWVVGSINLGWNIDGGSRFVLLNSNAAYDTDSTSFNSTAPTSSVFSLGSNADTNNNGTTYVAYLFATCPGVSKVGSYTGTGAAQNIDCGFSAGARFILIKRTDSTGDWYVYDSARGISSGNDPYFRLNSTAAEVAGTNYVDTFASGFTLTASAPAGLNANGGSYIFLAVA